VGFEMTGWVMIIIDAIDDVALVLGGLDRMMLGRLEVDNN